MADTHETSADIIAEMRRRIAVKMSDAWYTQEEWRKLCDRLEAAIKREKAAIEADALTVGGIVEAERKRERGNCAKLRETLREAERLLEGILEAYSKGTSGVYMSDVAEVIDNARAALAAPHRNCDMYDDRVEMYAAFKDWCNARGHTMEPKLAYDAFEWLLALATAKKGGSDAD